MAAPKTDPAALPTPAKIKRVRERLTMTQTEMARALGMSASAYIGAEHAGLAPRAGMLGREALSRLAGMDAARLAIIGEAMTSAVERAPDDLLEPMRTLLTMI